MTTRGHHQPELPIGEVRQHSSSGHTTEDAVAKARVPGGKPSSSRMTFLDRSQTNSKSNKSPAAHRHSFLGCLARHQSGESLDKVKRSKDEEAATLEHHSSDIWKRSTSKASGRRQICPGHGRRSRSLIELPNRIRTGGVPSGGGGSPCAKGLKSGPDSPALGSAMEHHNSQSPLAKRQSSAGNKKKSSNPIKNLLQMMTPKPARKKMSPSSVDQPIALMSPGNHPTPGSTPSASKTNSLSREGSHGPRLNGTIRVQGIQSWDKYRDEVKATEDHDESSSHRLTEVPKKEEKSPALATEPESEPNPRNAPPAEEEGAQDGGQPADSGPLPTDKDHERFMSDTNGLQGQAAEAVQGAYLETDLDQLVNLEPNEEWRILVQKLQLEAKRFAAEEDLDSNEEEGLPKKLGRSMSVILRKISEHEDKIHELEARQRRSNSVIGGVGPLVSTVLPLTLLGGLSAMYFLAQK